MPIAWHRKRSTHSLPMASTVSNAGCHPLLLGTSNNGPNTILPACLCIGTQQHSSMRIEPMRSYEMNCGNKRADLLLLFVELLRSSHNVRLFMYWWFGLEWLVLLWSTLTLVRKLVLYILTFVHISDWCLTLLVELEWTCSLLVDNSEGNTFLHTQNSSLFEEMPSFFPSNFDHRWNSSWI